MYKNNTMYNDDPVARPVGSLHVAEFARQADVTPATIRYYARVGLLRPGREPANSYRCFSSTDLRRVVFIRQAQELGLTIGDIKTVLKTTDQGEAPCGQVQTLVVQRLAYIEIQAAKLEAMKKRMKQAIELWNQMGDLNPREGELCPMIERIDKRLRIGAPPRSSREQLPLNKLLQRTARIYEHTAQAVSV